MSNTAFRWGIIGPGNIAHQFAQAAQTVNECSITAICSRNLQRAQAFAKQYQAPLAYDNVQQMLATAALDAVYIATPHSHHATSIKYCIEAGVAVLAEKPLTVNAHQAEALFTLAQKHHVFVNEALWSRFLPAWQQVDHWLNTGCIGEPRTITSQFAMSSLADVPRLRDPALAGGALLDLGIYPIALSHAMSRQRPVRIDSTMSISAGIDTQTTATIDYPQLSSQWMVAIDREGHNRMTISGSHGRIEIAEPFWAATRVAYYDQQRQCIADQHFPHQCNGYEYEISAVMAAI